MIGGNRFNSCLSCLRSVQLHEKVESDTRHSRLSWGVCLEEATGCVGAPVRAAWNLILHAARAYVDVTAAEAFINAGYSVPSRKFGALANFGWMCLTVGE